jgi:hypothetical protein
MAMMCLRLQHRAVWTYVVLASGFWLLLGGCSGPSGRAASSTPAQALSLRQGKILAAIGVKPESQQLSGDDHAALQDRRVAFGVNHLLAESFYETGKFRLVEEKDLRQRQLIAELVDLFWSESRPQPTAPEMLDIASRLEADLLAYGRVGYTRASAQRFQVGPMGNFRQRLRVNIEVCLYEVSSQKVVCREGEGTAQQEGLGVFYEFRNDRPDFEQSAGGRATKQAVASAVQALVASIRFSP